MATINVPGDKSTIQKAINSAGSGDTIKIFHSGGPYNESVTIDEPDGLTLEGVNNPTIEGDGVSSGSQPHATIHVDDGNGPTRNITIDGLTVRNPDGKFGIFAGTGTTNSDSDGIGGLKIINTTVEDISTDSSGGSLTGGPAGIGIRGDYGTDGNPGIDIGKSGQGNVIENVQTSSSVNAVGITLKSFTGDAGFGKDDNGNDVTDSSSPPATDTEIIDNDISKINGGDSSRTKGISVSGEFEDVLVKRNSITDITAANDGSAGNAFGITFTENGGSYSGNEYDIDDDGNGERIGPRDFEIKENDINNLTAGDPSALFIGGYEDLGDHSVKNNNFRDGTVSRFAGDQPGYQIGDGDTLNAEKNWWGDSTGPDGIISSSNTNNPVTLPDGNGITVLTNGTDGNGNPQTGLVDVTPWLDDEFSSGSPVAPVENSNTSEQYPTIQRGVNEASSSDEIQIDDDVIAGSFEEEVTIGKNITLTKASSTSGKPTISGQVRITGSVGSSDPLEVSELDIEYDSSNTGSGKESTVLFEKNQHVGVTFDSNTITAPVSGFAVYKAKSDSSNPDNNITFSDNTFQTDSETANQLVVIRSELEGSNSTPDNNVNITGNDFDGTVDRSNISASQRGSALDHRARDGNIKDNDFSNISDDSEEPLASATGANTSIKGTNGGDNSGFAVEGESKAGNTLQPVIDGSDANETVEIKQGGSSSNKEKYKITQNSGSSNQNTIEVNASNVIIEGKSSNGAELQVPGGSGPGIKVGRSGVEIKDVGITHSGSGGDTGIDINSDDCTLTNSEITVNPTAAVVIDGSGNVIEDSGLNSAGSDGIGILIEDAAGGSGDNLIALNDIDSEFDEGIQIKSGASDVDKVKIRFNDIRGDSNAINNNSGTVVDARSNFWGDKTGPNSPSSGDVDDPETGRTADGDGDVISSDVRYDEFLEIPNGFILDTGSPSSGRDTDGDGLHEDFNNDGDHVPTDGYLFLRAFRQGHFDRLAEVDDSGGVLGTDYTARFDFDGDGSDDISRSDIVSMVVNRNRD